MPSILWQQSWGGLEELGPGTRCVEVPPTGPGPLRSICGMGGTRTRMSPTGAGGLYLLSYHPTKTSHPKKKRRGQDSNLRGKFEAQWTYVYVPLCCSFTPSSETQRASVLSATRPPPRNRVFPIIFVHCCQQNEQQHLFFFFEKV